MLRFTPLFILALLSLPYYAHGFCVVNQHSDGTEFYVRQTDGFKKGTGYFARFRHKHVLAGQMQCCAHTNRSCVGSADENSIVKFYVHRFYHGNDLGAIEIDCPAGGTLTVSGTGPHAIYTTKHINGQDYHNTINYGPPRYRYFADLNKTRTINEE